MGAASSAAGNVGWGVGDGGNVGRVIDAHFDPFDITGTRRGEQRKQLEKLQREDEERRKKEVEDLFKKYSPGDIERVKDIAAGQVSGKLQGDLNLAGGDIAFLRNFGQSQGPSAQANYLLGAQELEQQGLMEDLTKDQSRMAAQQFDMLAQGGGAQAGSRERLASQIGSAGMMDAQRARREGALARLGILSDDEGRKLQVASSLPGQQLALSGERRAGLEGDRNAALAAAQANQAARLSENQANLATQGDLFRARAGILGGEQLARNQNLYANRADKSGPLGNLGGFLGGPSLGGAF